MENRKNLCAMIPESLYTKVGEEKEKLALNLSQYVEMVLNILKEEKQWQTGQGHWHSRYQRNFL